MAAPVSRSTEALAQFGPFLRLFAPGLPRSNFDAFDIAQNHGLNIEVFFFVEKRCDRRTGFVLDFFDLGGGSVFHGRLHHGRFHQAGVLRNGRWGLGWGLLGCNSASLRAILRAPAHRERVFRRIVYGLVVFGFFRKLRPLEGVKRRWLGRGSTGSTPLAVLRQRLTGQDDWNRDAFRGGMIRLGLGCFRWRLNDAFRGAGERRPGILRFREAAPAPAAA